ncbi:MAG: 2-C-methyl-D-erythritol 4-phosphate cytidylyltransferase [Dehalococcoidia bacterium]|nr:2-C-methyl-D-erythritol 4-phosphate cytidylyltransferase [Dehalococcoidia bacterium]HCV00095.1 2-C-methyl-D-erythritol 4-phosphate cytidylyltransferase [Dehalococcoidia bacterium]|tara:strand:+ start:889 stop:1560 length:672 start_codon:yes stop_codon:yes gene_type:complete
MQVDAIVVAAGRSTRFGTKDKLLTDLNGQPLIAWSLSALAKASSIRRVAIVGRTELLETLEAIGREVLGEAFLAVVAGGTRRQDSVEAGLQTVTSDYVAIHDGARPLVTPSLINACVSEAQKAAGAIPVAPVTDTIKEVEGAIIVGSPKRERLRAAQTPQVVHRQAWLEAAAISMEEETDDAAILARAGLQVRTVDGDPTNLKVTRLVDLTLAQALLIERGLE